MKKAAYATACAAAACAAFFPEIASAQVYYGNGTGQFVQHSSYAPQMYQGYTYQEAAPGGSQPLLFGVAAAKLCEIKSFLFAGVYILGAIAFVIFAIRALFAKFELKHFVPIIGALFIVATADLFIYWMSDEAFFCPTTFSMMG